MHSVIRCNNCQREPVNWRILCSRCNDKTAVSSPTNKFGGLEREYQRKY